jgi:hypothetical protein
VLLWVVFGLLAICVLGLFCARVLRGRTGLEVMNRTDLERIARQQADVRFREMHMNNAQGNGYPGL